MAKRKTAFIREGAEKMMGGIWSGARVGGEFTSWRVTGGNGVKFARNPYTESGWIVATKRTKYVSQGSAEQPVMVEVKNQDDIAALNEFVGIAPYKGWRA